MESAMLRAEINDLLTQTGPETPMGQLFRRYWQPVLLAEELPANDCPPVRVKILSERLLAFRDSTGRYGLIDEFCAHRGVSLWFGRNEEGGLRCPYHGWKYDVTGQAIEVPSEPETSNFCANVKLKSYPLVKRGDVFWAYLGDPAKQPPLPEWEFVTVPEGQTYTSKRLQECNWLQALEGGIDSSHVTFLHSGNLDSDPLFKGARGNSYNKGDLKPFFEVADYEGGLLIGARRNAEEGHYYWRVTPWVLPNFTMVPPRGDHPMHGHFWVPIDDEHCWVYSFDYHPTRNLTEDEIGAMQAGLGVHSANDANYRPLANKDNDYLIDREAQRRGETYSGVKGIAMQDASLQESMGPIVDRTKERLVATDAGIIKARQKLRKAALALAETGAEPVGNRPQDQKVRSVAIVLPADQAFIDGIGEAMVARPGVPQTSV
jgi:phenylpropionate dioxygenase-like ring-hydroxylating dioxygenase large terminal subunit